MAIEVACRRENRDWRCDVTVRDAEGHTTHVVTLTDEDLAGLDPGAGDPVHLVRASFEFLLEHEPRESILRTFELPVIGRYFPEYEREIGRRLASG